MNFIVPFSIGLVTSQVILSLILLSRSRGSSPQQRLYGALLIAIECYFLVPLVEGTSLEYPVRSVEAAVPVLFWLFSASLFDDDFKFRPWQLALVLVSVALPRHVQLLSGEGTLMLAPLFSGLGLLLKFSFLGLALWVVVRHWRGDLISSRRRFRVWFCVITGLYLFTFIFWRDMLDYPLPWPGTLEYLSSALVWVWANGILQQFTPGLLLAAPPKPMTPGEATPNASTKTVNDRLESRPLSPLPSPSPATSRTSHAPPGLLAAIHVELEEKYCYRDMDLSIGQLAYRLELPEHVLRTIINGELGYRNFKDFLNGFRIRETTQRLADPAEVATPILTIALDTGFRSLSNFNRVFKETHGMTPSTYRRTAVGEPDLLEKASS